MRICPNDKFIVIFAQRFHCFEDSFYKYFALNLLFQDTSYYLALKYSSFLCKFFGSVFYNLIPGSKSAKFAQKFRIFLKFLTLEGTMYPTLKFYVLVVVAHHKAGRLRLPFQLAFVFFTF